MGYFTSPTPNAQNTSSGSGFAPPPVFSYASGIYTNISISLVITSALGTIRYSTDGILPTSNSTLYTGPIIIGTNVTIKARVFPAPTSGLLPSEVIARNYLFLDSTTEDFSSNLPLLIISTEGKIAQLRAMSGHPLLIGAAMDAVKRWVYSPTLLNGVPVEVITEITVTFTLN